MRTEPNPKPFFGDAIGPWHDHFAILPIRTYDQQLVWLKWCRRRQVMQINFDCSKARFWFQYHAEPVGVRV